jgi:hypothetical protein
MELVTQANPGHHNATLDASVSRIIEGASWKRQRTVVILPADRMMATKVALSHWSLAFPPNQAVFRMLALGTEVGEAYSFTIDQILAHPDLSTWEYILTIEADNIPPPDGVSRLIAQMEAHPELHCIGGLYWTKGPGGVPQIWGDVKDPILNFRPQVPEPGKLVECCGTGMGFNLWRVSMFRELAQSDKFPRPWFKTLNGSEGQGIGTQDLYFWGRARPLGYRCAIDCSVLVGHHDAQADFCW